MQRIMSFALIIVFGVSLLVHQAQAQSTPSKRIQTPNSTAQEMPVVPQQPGMQMAGPQQTGMQFVPPKIIEKKVFCITVNITKFAYQFYCGKSDNNYMFYILRRDQSQPFWAMGANDFEDVKSLVLDSEVGFRGEFNSNPAAKYIYITYAEDTKHFPGNKYCHTEWMFRNYLPKSSCRDILAVRVGAN